MNPRVVDPSVPFLERHGVVILDGGFATELERRGQDLRDTLWSAKLLIDNPAPVGELHYDYFMAGADVGTSASYQATFEGFGARGLSGAESAGLLRLSVRLVEKARDRCMAKEPRRLRPLVAASLGCYGAFLANGAEYHGNYGVSEDDLLRFHRPRLEVLAETGADLLAFESIPCLDEAKAIARLLEEIDHKPAWVSFCCRDEREVSHGETLVECVQALESCDAVIAVGINCTAPHFIAPLLQSLQGRTRKRRVVYPNRGERWDANERRWHGPQESPCWYQDAPAWNKAGADWIGGCCRTTPEDIARMGAMLRGRNTSRMS